MGDPGDAADHTILAGSARDQERFKDRILEALTAGEPLATVLDLVARAVEVEQPSALCSILLVDEQGKRLQHGAAPSLPEFYSQAIHGVEIGDGVGSCGTAAYTKRRVVVEDIVDHPYWAGFKELAGRAGLRSCWSEPILSSGGQVLGTFAIYHRTPAVPRDEDIRNIRSAARLAALAIERHRADEGIRRVNADLEKRIQERTAQLSQMIEQLRASEERYRVLFNSGHDAVFVHHPLDSSETGRFIEVNDIAFRRLGYTREEILRMSVADINAPEAADRDAIERTLQAEGQVVFETVHVAKDGRRIPVEVSSRPFALLGQPMMLSVARDVSERKQRETQYRMLLQTAIEAFVLVDREGRILEVNDAGCRMSGYSRDELLRMRVWDVVASDELEGVRRHIERVIATGANRFQTRYRRKDRTLVDIEVSAQYSDTRGGILVVFIQNISQRLRAEAELRERAKWAEGLQKAGDELAVCTTVQDVAETAARALVGHLGQCMASVGALGADGQIHLMASSCQETHSDLPCRECFEGVLATGYRKLVLDPLADTPSTACRERGHALGFGSCATFPIRVHGRCIAALMVRCPGTGSDTPLAQNVPLIEVFCRHVGHLWRRCLDDEALLKLSRAITASPVSVVITDRQGVIEYVNPWFCQVTGYSREEAIGQNPRILKSHEHSLGFYQTMWETITAGKEWRGEFCNRRKDGELFWESAVISPIADERGVVTHFVAVKEDITERKRTDDALRRSQQDLSRAQAVAHIGSWRLDAQTNELLWSDETYRIFGIPVGTPLTYEAFLGTVHPEDRESVDRQWQAALRGEIYDIEFRVTAGERVKWVLAKVELERDGLGGFGTVQDITEQKQAGERLAAAVAAADAANRAKSVFLANMSHEIRTPMNAILGFSQLALREDALTLKLRQRLETINRSGEHLLALINDILEITRIETGRITTNPSTFDLHALIADLERVFRVPASAKHLRFEVEWATDVPRYIVTDEGKLRQILINLLGNAVKFTNEGCIALRVRTDRGEGDRLCLVAEVEDTGPGIAQEEIGKLFQAFGQTATGVHSGEGTGLGLAISGQFARILGGDITVASEVGKGSCFRVEISIQEGEGAAVGVVGAQRRVIGLEPGQGPYRVLVVDDMAENRTLLSDMLRAVRFETWEAANGEEAVAAFEQWAPHLILMDIRMPVMDGYEAIRRIKAVPAGAKTPVIAVTASAFEDDRKRVLATGADGYLRKPFRDAELFEAVEACLRVRYVYEEDATPPGGQDATALTPQAVAALPEGIVQQMREATISLDRRRLREMIEQVGKEWPQTAGGLRTLADGFQYDALLDLLQGGIPST